MQREFFTSTSEMLCIAHMGGCCVCCVPPLCVFELKNILFLLLERGGTRAENKQRGHRSLLSEAIINSDADDKDRAMTPSVNRPSLSDGITQQLDGVEVNRDF